jgi:hypothetical protein
MNKATNRDYIEAIKNYVLRQYTIYQEQNGIVDRFFFDSEVLKKGSREALDTVSGIFGWPLIVFADFEKLFEIALKEFRHNHATSMSPSISLQNKHSDTWLTKERIEKLNWNSDEIITYRARYLKYLESIGRASSIIDETDRSSLEIVKKIEDPTSNENFFTRGLVVGSVQSGKTANFNAVINSSIDIGYKLIIVLSGIMEDLRRQTQTRIEKEVVGVYLGPDKFDGVGKIASFGQLGEHKTVNQIEVPTSSLNDFNRTMQRAQFSLNNTNILICKKNTSVLQNLILWLNEYLKENNDKHNIPFIIIDDEADNASLNNLGHKGKEYANKINGHIRALLALFNKKTYIGYTATPFANVLQDINDVPDTKWKIKDNKNNIELEFDQVDNLFPHDFIELLKPPSNYLGPKNFFETRIDEVKKIDPLIAPPVSDYINSFPSRIYKNAEVYPREVRSFSNKYEFDEAASRGGYLDFENHKDYLNRTRAAKQDDIYPKILPNSLEEAIKCYVISIAIRLSRRNEMINSKLFHPHNTMLIHISRFSAWQTRTKDLIVEYVEKIEKLINNDGLKDEGSIFLEFERIWVKYFADAVNNIDEYLPVGYDDAFLTKKTFDDVKQYLVKAVSGIDVKAVNTLSKDELDYSKGEKKYIVVGGNKLSRGFTLEGLTINYFIRNTNYADTLLQMGRWFGYRPGYIDCCKLFTTADTLEKFDQCTWTFEELEAEFRQMSLDRKKPYDYATRVLTHPGTLQITRANILKNATVVKWSYADHLLQTTKFHIEKQKLEDSWKAFRKFYLENSTEFIVHKEGYLVLKTSANVLIELLDIPNTFKEDFIKPFKMFLGLANNLNKLTNWTVAIKTTGAGNELKNGQADFGVKVQLTERGGPKKDSPYRSRLIDDKIFSASGASSNIVTSGKDFSVTLNDNEINQAKTDFIKIKNPQALEEEIKDLTKKSNFPENIYRRRIPETEGLLVIYLMDLKKIYFDDELKGVATNDDLNLDIPLVGYAIGIPPIEESVGGTYLLNKFILDNIENSPVEEEDPDDEADVEFEEAKEIFE